MQLSDVELRLHHIGWLGSELLILPYLWKELKHIRLILEAGSYHMTAKRLSGDG